MDMPVKKTVSILCSGFGLGFYIPGLLIREKLRRMGVEARAEVFESLLPESKLEMVEKNRQAYHQSFRVALASQKVPGDTRESVDQVAVESLLAGWESSRTRDFICLSGHWVHILDVYRERAGGNTLHADLLYVDADLSPSWRWLRKLKPEYATNYREVRLYDRSRMEISYAIETTAEVPIPYSERNKRLVVHGGGWGIGTFRQQIPQMEAAGYDLDVICYAQSEAHLPAGSRRYFMDDPQWRTWHRDARGELTFPPFGPIGREANIVFASQSGCHGLHLIIRGALAIVSKPGAGTLIDSFGAATPLIMLEPFGPHEERNAATWLALRFGVPFRVWAEAGYPISMLQALHLNLLARRKEVQDYARMYSEDVLAMH